MANSAASSVVLLFVCFVSCPSPRGRVHAEVGGHREMPRQHDAQKCCGCVDGVKPTVVYQNKNR